MLTIIYHMHCVTCSENMLETWHPFTYFVQNEAFSLKTMLCNLRYLHLHLLIFGKT